MNHPFEQFGRVPTAQELLDYAFSKASSKTASLPATVPKVEKVRRKERKRIENTTEILIEKIKRIIEDVPNLEELPLFYRKLSNLLVNNDELRIALGRINGITPVLSHLKNESIKKINNSKSTQQMSDLRVQFFGRASSIIKKQAETLLYLEECRQKLQLVPAIDLNMPCVVIAGYPNVGKSSIMGKISSAQPTISDYPFTTKQIFIGMFQDKLGARYFQVIDTPGILDRPMNDRNNIEQQAILALNTIATLILFVFDPTPSAGYEISHQIALYNEIKDHFLENLKLPIKIIINKIDFATKAEIDNLVKKLGVPKNEILFTNAKTGENIDLVKNYLLTYFKETNYKR